MVPGAVAQGAAGGPARLLSQAPCAGQKEGGLSPAETSQHREGGSGLPAEPAEQPINGGRDQDRANDPGDRAGAAIVFSSIHLVLLPVDLRLTSARPEPLRQHCTLLKRSTKQIVPRRQGGPCCVLTVGLAIGLATTPAAGGRRTRRSAPEAAPNRPADRGRLAAERPPSPPSWPPGCPYVVRGPPRSGRGTPTLVAAHVALMAALVAAAAAHPRHPGHSGIWYLACQSGNRPLIGVVADFAARAAENTPIPDRQGLPGRHGLRNPVRHGGTGPVGQSTGTRPRWRKAR